MKKIFYFLMMSAMFMGVSADLFAMETTGDAPEAPALDKEATVAPKKLTFRRAAIVTRQVTPKEFFARESEEGYYLFEDDTVFPVTLEEWIARHRKGMDDGLSGAHSIQEERDSLKDALSTEKKESAQLKSINDELEKKLEDGKKPSKITLFSRMGNDFTEVSVEKDAYRRSSYVIVGNTVVLSERDYECLLEAKEQPPLKEINITSGLNRKTKYPIERCQDGSYSVEGKFVVVEQGFYDEMDSELKEKKNKDKEVEKGPVDGDEDHISSRAGYSGKTVFGLMAATGLVVGVTAYSLHKKYS